MKTLLLPVAFLVLISCAPSAREEKAEGRTTVPEALLVDTNVADTARMQPAPPNLQPDSAMEEDRD
jgi:hypothetical protein